MYSYQPLEKRLNDKGLNKSDLTINLGISSKTIAKMSKGEKGWLIGTCLDGQDTFKRLLELLDINV